MTKDAANADAHALKSLFKCHMRVWARNWHLALLQVREGILHLCCTVWSSDLQLAVRSGLAGRCDRHRSPELQEITAPGLQSESRQFGLAFLRQALRR